MKVRRALAASLTTLVLVACRSPTQIKVVVQTDVPCSAVTATAFTSGELGALESAPPTTESTSCSGGYLGTVVLVPSGSDTAQVGFKVVTALDGETLDRCGGAQAANDPNCIVSRRALRYLPNTPLTVIVDMLRSCEGVLCDPQSTCVSGVCRSATLDPSRCEGSGCTQSALTSGPADGGPDATIAEGGASEGGLGDGPLDVAAPDADAGPPADAGSAVPGCDLSGLQAGSPWPMEGYCPSGRSRSPLQGPGPTPVHKWKYVTGPVQAAPSIGADGTVFATVYTGAAVALDPADGGARWLYSGGDASSYWMLPVIAADDSLRFIDELQSEYLVMGLDASVRNKVPLAQTARGSLTIVGNGTVYYADNTADLVAMSGVGKVAWSLAGVSTDFDYPVVGSDGTLYPSTLGGSLSAVRPDGGVTWGVALDGGVGSTSVAIAVDGTLRIGATLAKGAGGVLYDLDPSSGAILWSRTVDTQGVPYNLAVADDGTTYVSGSNVISAWDATGTMIGSGVHRCSAPTLDSQGDVYAICDAGQLVSFDRTLNVRYQVPLPGFLGTVGDGVVIGQGGMLFVSTNDNTTRGAIDAFGPP